MTKQVYLVLLRVTRCTFEIEPEEIHLQSIRALSAQHSNYPGDDQVGTLHLRVAIRAERSHARGTWLADALAVALDRGVHGLRSFRRDGVQPHRGRRY